MPGSSPGTTAVQLRHPRHSDSVFKQPGRTSGFSQHDAPEFCAVAIPQKAEGTRDPQVRARGKPGARCTRGLVRKNACKSAHEHTGSAEAVRPSLRNGFTAYFELSLVSRA